MYAIDQMALLHKHGMSYFKLEREGSAFRLLEGATKTDFTCREPKLVESIVQTLNSATRDSEFQVLDAAIYDALEKRKELLRGQRNCLDFVHMDHFRAHEIYLMWTGDENFHRRDESMLAGQIDIRINLQGGIEVYGIGMGLEIFDFVLDERKRIGKL